MKSVPALGEDDHRLRPAWTELSAERQGYVDLFRDYIPRGQRHFKLRRELGHARLSSRSMELLQKAARSGDDRALQVLAGDVAEGSESVTDRLDPAARRRLMQAVKTKDTAPEVAVRSLLHRLGYRFRLHRRDLPGTPDIVLPGRRVAIFVHGCFWHGHGCGIGRLPKSKLDYWQPKIDANRGRDARKQSELEAAGWRVMTVWQCELKDSDALAVRFEAFLSEKQPISIDI